MSSQQRPQQFPPQQQRHLASAGGRGPAFPMSKAKAPGAVTMTYVPVHGGGTVQQQQQQMRQPQLLQQRQQQQQQHPQPPAAHSFPAMVTINSSALQMSFPSLPSVPLPPAVLNGIAAANAQHQQQLEGAKGKRKKSKKSKQHIAKVPVGSSAYSQYCSTVNVKLENFDVTDQCQYCQYYCDKKDRMRRHIRTVHLESKPFVCSLCPYKACRKDRLKRHMDTVHSDEKPFKCEFCEVTSNRKDKIKLHVEYVHLKIPKPPKKKKSKNPVAQQPSPNTLMSGVAQFAVN